MSLKYINSIIFRVIRIKLVVLRCFKTHFLMKKIQMVDLKGQYEHIKETVNTAIQEILDNTS